MHNKTLVSFPVISGVKSVFQNYCIYHFFLYLWPCGFQSFSVVFKHHVYWDIVAFLKHSVKLLVEGFFVSSFLIVKSGNLLHYNKLDTKNNNFESIHKLVTSVNDRHSYMFILDLIPFVLWSTCAVTSCQTLTFTSWKMNRDLERAHQVIRTSTGCFFFFRNGGRWYSSITAPL